MEGAFETFWNPERILAAVVVAFGALVLLVRWVKQVQLSPAPWGPEIDEALAQSDATPICHHCFTPQPELPGWFCPHCGAAVGPYNNWMEYVSIFSIGEVLSTGAFHRFSVSALTVVGLLFFSISQYLIFAPVYWFWLIRNVRRMQREAVQPPVESPSPE
jgi:hypothetical protein